MACEAEMSDVETTALYFTDRRHNQLLNDLDTIPLEEVKPLAIKKKFSELRKDVPENFEDAVLGTVYRKDGFVKGPRMV